MIRLIAAVDSEWGISKNGKIPWHLPEDLRFFREKTADGVVVMGKNTFFSIENRPLKDRINCIVSTTLISAEGAEIFKSLESVRDKYDDFWIIGGAALYNYALKNSLADYALITRLRKNYDTDKFICKNYLSDDFSEELIIAEDMYSIVRYVKSK
ncbi:MAG: dihydrofolate reductase [Holosporaceae bacterium]|jgi:dihydrofolate reductase|nr:dihydrofolate reductase [Holosporaceae bacterium]